MQPIQELDIYSSKNKKISAHIKKSKPSGFIPEATGLNNDIYREIGGPLDNAEDAFKAIIEYSIKIIEGNGDNLNRINNPCNTEFLDIEHQQKIVDNMSLKLTIEVNQ